MIKGPDKNEIRRQMEAVNLKIQAGILDQLKFVGREAVNIMRSTKANDYTDRTGNLRSSCGYAIAYNGDIKSISNFQTVKDGGDGSNQGKALASKIAIEDSQGQRWALVLVAGMNYASYVQNLHGRDVIESATVKAEDMVREFQRKLRNGD